MENDTAPPTIARIEHIAVWTDNIERLQRFYEEQFGAVASPPVEDADAGTRSVTLDFCGTSLMLMQAGRDAAEASSPSTGYAHVAFSLDGADAVDARTAHLAAAGHHILRQPHRTSAGYYRSVVLDPDGNTIELTV